MREALEDRDLELGPAAWESTVPVRIQHVYQRVRTLAGRKVVADSKRVKLLLEARKMPVYYFPPADVDLELLIASDRTQPSVHKGRAKFFHVRGAELIRDAAWCYPDAAGAAAGIQGMIAFYWDKMDAWYEEDDQVFVHPRDPYHRVDVLHSSRRVTVEVDGTVVADSNRPRILLETSLPPRFYLPQLDVRLDLLQPSDTHTRCPYKGVASYWSVTIGDRIHEDLVWSYPSPIPECSKIENLLCFFNEKVDLRIDGELLERPRTPWS